MCIRSDHAQGVPNLLGASSVAKEGRPRAKDSYNIWSIIFKRLGVEDRAAAAAAAVAVSPAPLRFDSARSQN